VSHTLVRTLTFAVVAAALANPSFAQAVRIPGTNVSLAPPEGFSVASQYPGFERADIQASIMVTELPVAAPDMVRSMTGPALATKGMVQISARNTIINDRPARLLHVRQKASGAEVLKWILVTGDARTTIMIVGSFVESGSPRISEIIQQSLLTASWGSAASPSPFEGLPFRITPTAKLKLAHRMSNMLMLTESGTAGSPGSTEALYIAGHSLGRAQIADVQKFAESRARQTTLITNVTNFAGRALQVAGLDAYELEADAIDARSGRAMRLYQVIIPDETGYFILQGLSRADRAVEIFTEFRAVTASFLRLAPAPSYRPPVRPGE
jgi:hypothetical protein